MSAAPARPVFKDAAQRRAAVRSLVWRLPAATLTFAALGPLIGMAIIYGPFFVAGLTGSLGNPAGAFLLLLVAALAAYHLAIVPAAFTGFWVALLATFATSKKQLYAGAAAIGATCTWLFSTAMMQQVSTAYPAFNFFTTLLAITGALAATFCAWLIRNWPLGTPSFESRSHRRNRLAKARADRLAKERSQA